jgi:hypothetical protein
VDISPGVDSPLRPGAPFLLASRTHLSPPRPPASVMAGNHPGRS